MSLDALSRLAKADDAAGLEACLAQGADLTQAFEVGAQLCPAGDGPC